MSTTSWSGATPRRADNVERAPHISEDWLSLIIGRPRPGPARRPRHRQLPVPGVDLTPSHYDGADRAAEE